jgi:hypothetical protein
MVEGAGCSLVKFSLTICASELVVSKGGLANAFKIFRFAMDAARYSLMKRAKVHRNSPVVSFTEGIGRLCD